MAELRTLLQDGLAGSYTIGRELGRGGMATVFLAHDVKHDRSVALKVLHPTLAAALGGDRFLREIRISAHLQHPHILTLIDSGEVVVPGAQPLLYYVMPYVEGESLRERMTREGRLAASDALKILQDVLDALAHAHAHGIVHRDIKPENIMLAGRHALVVDFGVAKAASVAASPDAAPEGTVTMLGLAIGTPAYMAPEQAAGQSVDARADLYAAGVVAYEMLAGQPPFTGSTPQAVLAAQVTQAPAPLASVAPDIAAPLQAAVMRCLEKDPDQRWQSAEELLAQLESFRTPGAGTTATGIAVPGMRTRSARRSWAAAAAGAVLLLGSWFWFGPRQHERDRRWVHDIAIPQLLALSDRGQWDSAYALARRVEQVAPRDSLFRALTPRFAQRSRIVTSPAGAKVWMREYAGSDSTWSLLGVTPLESVLLPLNGGGRMFPVASRLRIEAAGYRRLDLLGTAFGDSARLDRADAIPPEMVRVEGGSLVVQAPGFDRVQPVQLADYLMDRFEVTNREFKRFVDGGGYRRQELWEHPFTNEGKVLEWPAAMALLIDRSGRPGPSTWEGGDYPTGQDDFPVAGVSWYEAAAYAKSVGKSLPTLVHWNHAATVRASFLIIPRSNFSGQGTAKVGSSDAISAFGTYDMAGNVREWCLNAAGADRFIVGGGWNDQPYQFNDTYTQPPFNRSPANGIRLVKYLVDDTSLAIASRPLQRISRDFLKERPVSDAVFAAYRQMYQYDHTPLGAKVLETVDEGDWTRELVRLNAAYNGDTLLVYVYLPKAGVKPYPAVVYFPAGGAIQNLVPQDFRSIDFVLKSGRAVLYPVYKGIYQRRDSLKSDTQDSTNFYRDHVLMWAKDMRRGIDYLETRSDITTRDLVYYGLSWGGALGGLLPAIEPRIKSSILVVAGLDFPRTLAEVDPLNFVTRVTVPTLMLNGRYDFFFPVESSQIPMFRMLGAPAADKRHVVDEGSHFFPRARLIQEVLEWLDKYQPLAT